MVLANPLGVYCEVCRRRFIGEDLSYNEQIWLAERIGWYIEHDTEYRSEHMPAAACPEHIQRTKNGTPYVPKGDGWVAGCGDCEEEEAGLSRKEALQWERSHFCDVAVHPETYHKSPEELEQERVDAKEWRRQAHERDEERRQQAREAKRKEEEAERLVALGREYEALCSKHPRVMRWVTRVFGG